MGRFAVMVLTVAGLTARAFGYGAEGHSWIGAIADVKLKNAPAAAKISAILDGLSLAQAAALPDQIRNWDRTRPDSPQFFRLPDHPRIEKELQDFWFANPPYGNDPATKPSHHWFHYTDVPVVDSGLYAHGLTGRSQWDIVHMIPLCIRVLQGTEPADNPRKITPTIAVILLAHYLGDIHQPLHVGAGYFNTMGRPVNPDSGPDQAGFDDQGGNGLTLYLTDDKNPKTGKRHSAGKLHTFWDTDAVLSAQKLVDAEMGFTGGDRAAYLADKSPMISMSLGDPSPWTRSLADEILPLAAEAHARLIHRNITIDGPVGRQSARGEVLARPPGQVADRLTYDQWAAAVVRRQIHLAGWRLALLLQSIVK